jgi:hypothetical protein
LVYKYTLPASLANTTVIFNSGSLQTEWMNAQVWENKYYNNGWVDIDPLLELVGRCNVENNFNFSIAGGSFVNGTTKEVVLTANKTTSTIYYTTDGTTPTLSSPSVLGSKIFSFTNATTLKAFVKNAAGAISPIKTEIYKFYSPITVYFKKPATWLPGPDLYASIRYSTEVGATPIIVQMNSSCGDWKVYTFPADVIPSKIAFTDTGTNTTPEITVKAGAQYYDNGLLNTEPVDRCPPTVVYFKKPANWKATVNAYYYHTDASAPQFVEWPGVAMTKDCGDWYRFTYPKSIPSSYIIINDETLKTEVFIPFSYINTYIDGNTYNSLDRNTDYTIEPANRCPVVAPDFTNSQLGSTFNTGTTVNVVLTANEATSINLIFNNGNSGTANQTPDLLNKIDGYTYTWGGSTAKMVAKEEVKKGVNTVVIYPNPVSYVLQITADSKVSNYRITSVLGAIVKEGKSNDNSIDVSDLSNGLYYVQLRFENGEEHIQKIIKK